MRVLLVNDWPPGGTSGVEVHLGLLADALREAGDEVAIAAPAVDRRGLRRAADLWDPRARREVAAVARWFQPDVVHHHNVLRELSPAVFGATPDVPALLTVHDHRLLGVPDAGTATPRRLAGGAAAAVARRAARRLAAVVAVDDRTAELLAAAGLPGVTRVELFAADPGPIPAPAGLGDEIVFAGRLAPDKGAAELVAAFLQIADDHPQARLVLAGDGPLRPALTALAATRPGRIELLGSVDHADALARMAAARLVAIPSVPDRRPETGPQTVLEAALRARPVVVSAGLPLTALVAGSEGGVVVPPGDVPSLAQALDALLGDPDLATAAGDRARTAALERHVPAVVVPRLRALYSRVAGGAAA